MKVKEYMRIVPRMMARDLKPGDVFHTIPRDELYLYLTTDSSVGCRGAALRNGAVTYFSFDAPVVPVRGAFVEDEE